MEKNFVVYKSSAGSGKTFTLVKEYLKLALSNKVQINSNYRRILALTFTNKAAAEMRLRIISALISISDESQPSQLAMVISSELRIDVLDLKERTKQLLNHLLHHYSDFAVSTIDSFSHKIIKTFAHDLKLPVNFNLETDSTEFYYKVIHQLLDEIGVDAYTTELLTEFSLTNAEEDHSWDPEKGIQEFASLLQKESSNKHVKSLSELSHDELNEMKSTIQSYLANHKKHLIDEAKKAITLMNEHKLTDADFNSKSRGPQQFFNKCIEGSIDDDAFTNAFNTAIETNQWLHKSISPEKKSALESIELQLTEIGRELKSFYLNSIEKFNRYSLLNKRLYPILLINKIQQITNELKQEEQIVFIEEFNSRIFEFIKNEPVSFIYERLGERYKNFLIDEFQDTSTLQWQNLLPLIENSLASANYNLIVGDGKQSIYRWRNANIKQFAILPDIENPEKLAHIELISDALNRNYSEKQLDTNYRSYSTIINFNNAIFEYLSSTYLSPPLSNIYLGQFQKSINTLEGYVTITNTPQEKSTLEDFNCLNTLQRIKDAITNKYAYRDISILTFSNKQGSIIANYLNKQNIPVVSNESLLLKNNIEVNTLIAFFKYIQNTKDLVSAATVLNYFLHVKRLQIAQFHSFVRQLKSTSLFQIINELGLEFSEIELQSKNLLDTAVYMIEKLALNKNNSANIYLRFLLDEISKYMATKNSNMNEFLVWWDKRSEKSSLIISSDIDAVKILTIHASKGLEFPIVILPFCNWAYEKNNDQWVEINDVELPIQSAYFPLSKKASEAGFKKEVDIESQETFLDKLNQLYVAFTRAESQLHIISSVNKGNPKKTVNNLFTEFLKDSTLMRETESGYELGALQPKIQHKPIPSKEIIELKPLKLIAHSDAIKIKGSYFKNNNSTSEAKEKGIVMHYILSKIKLASDIKPALKDALTKGYITSHHLSDLQANLEKLINLPEIADYFTVQFNTKIESEILTDTGEVLRPDRIAISDHETCIIDYKTGQENTKKYLSQMQAYENALLKLNYKNVKKILVYIDDFKVIQVY